MFRGFSRRRLLTAGGIAALAVVVLAALALQPRYRTQAPAPIPAPVHDIAPVRLARPDALIVSRSLRDLPRDLLAVPLLKAVLTEDFVFYYRRNSRLLGIEGTLRRIAYEHHLGLRDDIVATLLDRPADVALWRGRDGRLSHWLIDTSGPSWPPLLKLAARLAGSDPAIRQLGTLALAGGGRTPLYRLDYGRQRPLYFAGAHGHLLLFSDADMARGNDYGDAAGRRRVWQALLDHDRALSPLRSHFGLQRFRGKHTVLVDADAISFNYQHFAPDLEALRFDFDGRRWVSYLRLAPHSATRFASDRAWRALPDDPALCASAPLDWNRLRPVLQHLHREDARVDPALADVLGGPATVCWFGHGSLYTPLALVPIASGAHWDRTLGALFTDSVGNSWPRYRNAGAPQPAPATSVAGAARTWRARVATDFGTFPVTLVRAGRWLVFSADAEAVGDTVAVIDHRRPALAESLPAGYGRVIAVITPSTLSQLLQRAVAGDLPARAQPLLHQAAAERLQPRLTALASFPPYALTLPSALDTTHRYWQPVAWHALSAAH